jgi:hypothetical protein
MPNITPSEIEEAMNRCVEDPRSLTPRDLDAVIAYIRHAAVQAQTGGAKPRKNRGTVDLDQTISLDSLGLRKKIEIVGKTQGGLKKL